MFNIGGGEVIVIALIALIVLGPQRLPDAARQIGKVMGDLRRVSSGFQNEIRTAFEDHESASAPAAPAITPANPARVPGDADITASVSAVAAQSSPPAAKKAPSKKAPAKKAAATKKAPVKKVSAKKQAAAKKQAPAKKAPAKKRSS